MSNTNCILFQSAASQQISNLTLTGFVTIDAYMNSDGGKLYGAFSYSSPNYSFQLYSDSSRSQLVASATATTTGLATITQANDSGISGSVNIIPGTVVNDAKIEAICFLSTDNDIPLDNLTTLSDYNNVYGFAEFHRQAFDYVRQKLQSRFESQLWNPNWIDYNQINSGTGGYDLSKILNWRSSDIKEASAQYALHLIARKQAIEPDGIFAERAKCAYERCVALLDTTDVQFDIDNTRVARQSRNLSTWKTSRA